MCEGIDNALFPVICAREAASGCFSVEYQSERVVFIYGIPPGGSVMRIRLLATLVLAGLGLVALSGCHDGYSSVGYNYSYGSYGSSCDYGYYTPSYSHYSFGYRHHGHHGHGHHGHGHHHGGHHRSHCHY
jgi:hypothetical protein